MGLSNKQQIFIDEYLKCWNATEAARRAGYADNRHLHTNANKLLQNTTVQEEIQARLRESQMSADEAMQRLTDIGRGDMADLMDVTSMGWALDMQKAQERGKTKLIKKVKQTTITKIGRKQDDDDEERTYLEVELYPADSALRDILKIHGKITPDSEINIRVSLDDNNQK